MIFKKCINILNTNKTIQNIFYRITFIYDIIYTYKDNQIYHKYQKLFKMLIKFRFGGGLKNGYAKISKSSKEEKGSG